MARSLRVAERALGWVLACWGAYAIICWSRYGRDRSAVRDRDDPLDAFISDPEIDERHETRVHAPAAAAMKTLHELDVNRSPAVWLIFNLRTLPTRLRGGPVQWEYKGLVDQMLAIGWGVFVDIPDRLFVAGAVTRPWEADVQFQALPPDEFERFHEPGYVKIVWTLEADELPSGHESIARTRTRVTTTDPSANGAFAATGRSSRPASSSSTARSCDSRGASSTVGTSNRATGDSKPRSARDWPRAGQRRADMRSRRC